MKVLHTLPKFDTPSVVVIGNFDGIHLGHRELIRTGVNKARQKDLDVVVLTFDPHPMEVFLPENTFKKIISKAKKDELLENLGVNYLVEVPFTKEFSEISPEEFIEKYLVQSLKAEYVFVGFNYAFGKNASGNTQTLQDNSSKFNYELHILPPVIEDGLIVSSSIIRELLSLGEVNKAAKLLGYYPILSGKVEHGFKNGRLLGFPTANIRVDKEVMIPKNGVYASTIKFNNKNYQGMTNIGYKPTIRNHLEKTIEVNIFDFEGDLYGEFIEISLHRYTREEIKFNNLIELKSQLLYDKKMILDFFSTIN